MGLIEFIIEVIHPEKSFRVVVKDGTHTAGEALFFKNPEGQWQARVDVDKKHRGGGVATSALQTGDRHIHSNHPDDERLFKDINSFSYNTYTRQIGDEQIISYNDNELRFRP